MPSLRIPAIKAKLDTGARSSALHVVGFETFKRGGREWVRFTADPDIDDTELVVDAEVPVLDERVVRTSAGHEQLRVVIRTNLEINGRAWPIDVTLAQREMMRFRMLIGREALRGRAVVDPNRSYLADHPRGRTPRSAAKEQEEE